MSKKCLVDCETIEVTCGSSAITTSVLAEKKEDPGAFIIRCTIGMHKFEKALCDHSASINLIPHTIYQIFGLGTPTPIKTRLFMEDRSIKKPIIVLYDVLVKVDHFILLVNSDVLGYEIDQEIPIILGISFLAIEREIAYMDQGKMKF